MKTIRLMGLTSPQRSLNCREENAAYKPHNVEWCFEPGCGDTTLFLDHCIQTAYMDNARHKVAMLYEPHEFRPWHYIAAIDCKDVFDLILTHYPPLLEKGFPFVFFPAGGSWIAEHGIYEKSALVSFIPGSKRETSGHKLRFDIAEAYHNKVDVFLPYFFGKSNALRNYFFSVVVENSRIDYWFTEKLLDCMSQGTIPIYWGMPSVEKFFNPQGIISFETVEELGYILANLSPDDYYERLEAVKENFEIAKRYYCPEDWLSEHYPDYF